MADETQTGVASPSPIESAAAAPVVAPEISSPTPSSPSLTEGPSFSETKTETPISEDSAAPEVKQAEVKDEQPRTAETLLAGDKKTEEKKAEVKLEEVKSESAPEQKNEVVVPEYEILPPEGVEFDKTQLGEFTKALGDFEVLTKASHEEVQKLGQSLLNRHFDEMQRYTKYLTDAWERQANDWKESFLKSPEFANRTDTALNAAIDAISVYGGTKDQQQEFRNLMESSKVGNHPAMIRLLSNVMQAKAEPKPLAAPQISMPEKMSKVQKMYGKKSGS